MCRLLLFAGQRLSDTSVSSAKTDERIDVQFRKHTRGAPVNHVLIGGPRFHNRKGHFGGSYLGMLDILDVNVIRYGAGAMRPPATGLL